MIVQDRGYKEVYELFRCLECKNYLTQFFLPMNTFECENGGCKRFGLVTFKGLHKSKNKMESLPRCTKLEIGGKI